MACFPDPHRITAEQFLQIDFGSDIKAELDDGIVRMMAGGTAAHSRIQMNVLGLLWQALRGTGCRPYGPDMGLRTHAQSVRYPDVSVYCGKDSELFDAEKAFDDPVVVVEVLSPSTRVADEGTKVREYRALPSVQTIILINSDSRQVQVITRTGPQSWTDSVLGPEEAIAIPNFGLTLSQSEIFAR